MSSRKVLHVDDDEHTLRLVAKFLQNSGYDVVSSSSPFIAPIIQRERPDVLVMDIDMPLLSGDKIVGIIRSKEFSTLPVVYFSSKSERELESLSARTPRSWYIRKSDGLPALAAKISTLV